MAGTENTAPSDLSFTDQVAQMDRGLKVFLSGLVIGLTVLVVTVVRMCRAALGTEGGYGMEETTPPPPKHPPKPTAAPSKAHATAEIRPAGKVALKAKNKSGPKAAGPHGRDLEEGAGGQAHSRGRGKPSRSAPPKASSSGRKAAPGKALGGEKSCRKAATFQPVAKASDDGVSDDMRVAESDEEEGSSSPLLTRVTFQAPDGETVETELDLADVSSLQELQDLVAEEWRELVGGTMSSSLKMEYEDEDGDFVKVSRSTPIEEVTASPAIRFLRSKGTGRQHRYEM